MNIESLVNPKRCNGDIGLLIRLIIILHKKGINEMANFERVKQASREMLAEQLGNVPEESVDFLVDVLNEIIPRNEPISIVDIVKILPLKTMPDIPTTELATVVRKIVGKAGMWRNDVHLVEGFFDVYCSADFLNVYKFDNGYIDFLMPQRDRLPADHDKMINRTAEQRRIEYEFSFDTMTLNKVGVRSF